MKKIALFLVNFEIWLVAIVLATSLVSARFLPVAVITAAIFWLVRLLATKRLSIQTLSDIPIVILTLSIPITLWVTAFPEITTVQVLRLLSGIGFYYTIVNWSNSSDRLSKLINGLILSGLLLALSAPFVVEWSAKLAFIPSQLYQPFSLILQDSIHPNVIAGSLALILPISVGWILYAWQDLTALEKILAILSSLVMFLILGLTQSRAAWIAIFIVFIFFPIFRWRWGWILSVLGILATLLATYAIGLTRVMTALVSGGSIRGIRSRLEIWERAYFMIRDFPFTGIGMGSFTQVADAMYPFTSAAPGTIFHAHNLFLQIGVDLGLMGLIAWLTILAIHLIQAWKSRIGGKNNKNLRTQAIGFALLGSMLVLIIHGMMDSVVWGMVRPAPLVWAIWGIGSSLYLQTQKKYSATPPK